MTKEEWDKVESRLYAPYCSVPLMIDGYDVNICIVQTKKLKFEYAIYIDGKIALNDCIHDCEIRNRFYQKHKRSLLTKKDKDLFKIVKKSEREKFVKANEYFWYEPYWQSFKSLKAHLIKCNNSIELLTKK